jgi:hypothetical protein
MFDPAKRQAVLNPMHQTVASPATLVTGGLSEITSFLTSIMKLVGVGATPGITSTPATPLNQATFPSLDVSPAKHTPSKLSQFLKHAEEKLGVCNATFYEGQLQREGFGPDILHRLGDEKLTALGLSLGDAMQLKEGSSAWWHGPDAKQKHVASDDLFQQGPSTTPPNKKVQFETRYAEGGAYTFFGPRMIETDPDGPEPVDQTYYYCEARQGMFPIPKGYMALAEGADEDDPFRF